MNGSVSLDNVSAAKAAVDRERTPDDIVEAAAVAIEQLTAWEDVRVGVPTSDRRTSRLDPACHELAEAAMHRDSLTVGCTLSEGDSRVALSIPLGWGMLLQATASPESEGVLRSVDFVEVFCSYVTHRLREERPTMRGSVSVSQQSSRLPEFRDLVDQSPDAFYAVDAHSGDILDANETACSMLGYTRKELTGLGVLDVNPEANQAMWDDLATRLSTEHNVTIETVHARKDGTTIPVEVHISRTQFDRPYNIAVVRDITDRKRRERLLSEAHTRYATIFDIAPDPIIVVETGDRVVIDVNTTAERLLERPTGELVGASFDSILPSDAGDSYRTLFDHCAAERRGRVRSFEDGTPLEIATRTGACIPVEMSFQVVSFEHQEVLFAILRDLRTDRAYEQALADLNHATQAMFEHPRPKDIADILATTVSDSMNSTKAIVYVFDDERGCLDPIAVSPHSQSTDDYATVVAGDHPVWQAFSTGMREIRGSKNTAVGGDRQLITPIGDYGVLCIQASASMRFSSRELELVEIVTAAAQTALDRAYRHQDIDAQKQEIETHARQLEELETINGQIRNVLRAVATGKTRREIEELVCSQLVETDAFSFAWVGEPDHLRDRLLVRATAGEDRGYLDLVSLQRSGGTEAEPAVEAIDTRSPVSIERIGEGMHRSSWRSKAVDASFGSVIAVPLRYQGTALGVLAVYSGEPDAFSNRVRSALMDIGDLLGNAFVAHRRKQALLSNHVSELEFSIRDQACFFLRFAKMTGSRIELERIIPQHDESSHVFIRLEDGDLEDFLTAAEESRMIREAEVIGPAEEPVIRVLFVEPFIATHLADHGIRVQTIASDRDECRVCLAVPGTADLHQVADIVHAMFPDAELIAKRGEVSLGPGSDESLVHPIEVLTARQREVMTYAYARGFFESPRTHSGEELAAELDVSPSAFHRHIRTAERLLFEWMFDRFPDPEMSR